MKLRVTKVGGWTFVFDVSNPRRRRLVDVEGWTTAHGDYWGSLVGAIGLAFGLGQG